jgi:hypothetical protein
MALPSSRGKPVDAATLLGAIERGLATRPR